jgi:pimeloyl-ACP methyl ester carboxylesterase
MLCAMSTFSRRALLQSALAVPFVRAAFAQNVNNPDVAYGATTIPIGIRSRLVNGVNGITMHALEAGYETPNRPAVLLIHGFPELAFSWRNVMLPLAKAGYHVIAPDQRGYGRSGGTDVKYDDDLAPFSTLNRVRDMMVLINALGHRHVALVVGHDFGSPVAGWCALTRPDVFRSVVMMSAPFGGPGLLPFNTAPAFAREALSEPRRDGAASPGRTPPPASPDDELAKLNPPRKHYQTYYTTREANENMWKAPQGLHDFLRAYYHAKSGDWPDNKPFPLASNAASEQAKLPRYYVMDRDKGMAEQVASDMPTPAQIAACKWLPDEALRVYTTEYGRTGFQGGLNSYRVGRAPRLAAETQLFAGRTIDVPALFVSGKSDWGVYQNAGSLDRMQRGCTKFEGVELMDGAGHWVQQERAAEVAARLVSFLTR